MNNVFLYKFSQKADRLENCPRYSGKKLLVVFAHPDDETFACGGTIAKYANYGVEVALICATRGEAGEINDSSISKNTPLGEIREQELKHASKVLGIKTIHFLGYRDSGMNGSPDNHHPLALCQADQKEVSKRVGKIIRDFIPDVIITFDPNGGYGHPDHVAIHQATLTAHKSHEIGKLYYVAFPVSIAKQIQALHDDEQNLPTIDIETVAVPDELITNRIDIKPYEKSKRTAALCHRSQITGDDAFSWAPEEVRCKLMSTEYYLSADSYLNPTGCTWETDLFQY